MYGKKPYNWLRRLVKELYNYTKQLPNSENYGLKSQMRRAAISIPSNIAEEYKRQGLGEYIQFLSIADASAAELEAQIIITKEIYPEIDTSVVKLLTNEVQKILITIIRKLKANP